MNYKNRFILISKDGMRQEIFDVTTAMPTIERRMRNPVSNFGMFVHYRGNTPPEFELVYTTRTYKQDTVSAIDIGDTFEMIHFYREV